MKLLASALLAPVLAGALCAAQGSLAPEAETFARLTAELVGLERGVEPTVVSQRIHALGSACAPLVFEALCRQELPTAEGALVLGEREHQVLLDGARRIGREPFVRPWSEAASSADGRRRKAAIELVGLTGKVGDLGTAVLAATPLEAETRPDSEALAALELAAGRLLARDPGTLALLRPAILNSPVELGGSLIRAAGHTPSGRTLVFLVDLLGFEERLELPLLSQIARVARAEEPPFEEAVLARVRPYLDDPDRQVVRTAAMALAVLQDEEAVPALLALAASPDAALSGAAFAALERTTGLALPRRPERWSSWFAVERSWMAEEKPRVVAALQGEDVPRILAALRELAQHRLGRQRLALLAERQLGHDDRGVRLEACRTLRALATPAVRASLEGMLSDANPEVSLAAMEALRAL